MTPMLICRELLRSTKAKYPTNWPTSTPSTWLMPIEAMQTQWPTQCPKASTVSIPQLSTSPRITTSSHHSSEFTTTTAMRTSNLHNSKSNTWTAMPVARVKTKGFPNNNRYKTAWFLPRKIMAKPISSFSMLTTNNACSSNKSNCKMLRWGKP